MSVADICSGTGDFAELVSKNSTYTGWDINDDFINYAKKKYAAHKNKQFVNANILKEKNENKPKQKNLKNVNTDNKKLFLDEYNTKVAAMESQEHQKK